MPVSVNQPQRREKDEDPLDVIVKGLNIAQSIYGIKDAGEKSALLKQKQEQDTTIFNQGQEEFERKKQGTLNANELLGAQKDFDIAQPGTKDAMPYQVQKNGASETVYLKRKSAVQDPTQSEYRNMMLQEKMRKAKEDAEAAAFSKTPEGRMAKLNSGDKGRLDNAKLGLITVQGMADALKQGENTFSLIGDNNFTQQRSLFEEALGRMQSGGAISKEEEIRFKNMAPTFRDSAEMQAKKLQQLEQEMNSRLGTLGFKAEELGIAKRDSSAPAPAPATGISPQDAQAELARRQIKKSGMAGNLPKGKP